MKLEGQPVIMHEIITHDTSFPEITTMNRLSRLTREAWLLGLIEAEVLLYQADLIEPSTVFVSLIRNRRMRQSALRSLAQRPPENLSERARARLEVWADHANDGMVTTVRNEFLTSVSTIRTLFTAKSDSDLLENVGFTRKIVLRWSRGNSLDMLADMLETAPPRPDFIEQAEALEAVGERVEFLRGMDRHRYSLALLLIPSLGSAHKDHLATALGSRIILHELGHGPWPNDPFAPVGTPLRRHERNGVLIGAWSVGRYGVDDGALPDDIRIELRPPWHPPLETTSNDNSSGVGGRRGASR